MKRYAFISRHTLTTEQMALARNCGIELIPVGDRDAFTLDVEEFCDSPEFSGVVVVHPAAALRCVSRLPVGVFENGTRSVEGGEPQFFAKALHLFESSTTTTDPDNVDYDPQSQSCPIIRKI